MQEISIMHTGNRANLCGKDRKYIGATRELGSQKNVIPPSQWEKTCWLEVLSLRYILPKRRLSYNGLHDVVSQKAELFLVTAARTSSPTHY
jgi:hypothetical protein